KAKPKRKVLAKAKPTKTASHGESLEYVFNQLKKVMTAYTPQFKAMQGEIRGKQDFHIKTPQKVVIPGAYSGKPVDPALASIILQKGYVGFYFMPVYMEPSLRKKLSPNFMKLLKGKSCFYFKGLDDALVRDVKFALDEGVKVYESRGWV